jgi:hypothetical protein
MKFKSIFIFFFFISSFIIGRAQAPEYLLELRNDVQVSATEYEFDIYLLRTGSVPFEYGSGQFGILINPQIKNQGAISVSIVSGSSDPELVSANQDPTSISFYDPGNVIKIAARVPPGEGNGAVISNVSPGTKICRVRVSNSVAFSQYQPNLTWTTTTIYPTQVYAYVESVNTAITSFSDHTTSNLNNPVLNVITTVGNQIFEEDLRVYPNPFQDQLTIDYVLLQKSHVSLSVFNLYGKLVDQLLNEDQQGGSYTITWDSDNQPDGVYLVRLMTDLRQKISKITLIR